jgi:hypothetical protein
MPSTQTDRIDGLSTSVAVKAPVKAATTGNITLSGEQTIDGVAVVANDRVLVKNQTTATENGIYCVSADAWVRTKDFNGNRDVVQGTLIFVTGGTNEGYHQVTNSGTITIGTTELTFSRTQLASTPNFVDLKNTYGAVGDGSTDDTAALQAALDSNQIVWVPPGSYRITSNLVVDPIRNRGCGFIGMVAPSQYPGTQQTGGPAWDGTEECVILFDGSAGATSAVIACSAEAVGTEPASTFDTTVYSFVLHNMTLDGNDKAQYGFYAARLQGGDLNNVYARRCEGDGFYLNGIFSGSYRHLTARLNGGRGISIGAAGEDLSWTTNNLCNAVYFERLHAIANGGDKDFDESTDPNKGCGIFFRPHRACVIDQATAELNDGVGLVFAPTSTGNVVRNLYTELNSDYEVGGTDAIDDGRASKSYGVRFEGISGAVSYANKVDGWFSASEELWIQGTEPSTGRPESAPEFRDIVGGSGITAAWANYKIVNGSENFLASVTGSSPTGPLHSEGGFLVDKDHASLDYFNEGTFTPTIEGSSVAGTGWVYGVNAGSYTRVGQMVFFTLRITPTTLGSGASGGVLVKGLPFTSRNTNGYQAVVEVSADSLTTSVVSCAGRVAINTAEVGLYIRTAAAASETAMAISDLSTSSAFTISGCYQV